MILWSLGLKIGDTLDYPGENGKMYKLKFIAGLDNSIFQGSVLVSRHNLRRMFPGVSGSRILLVDNDNQNLGLELGRSLSKLGADIETCSSRLNRFGSIQNTYLMVFSGAWRHWSDNWIFRIGDYSDTQYIGTSE